MKRRTFIFLAGATVIAIPVVFWRHHHSSVARSLGQPEFLGYVCDEPTIRDIGAAYCARTPDEAREDKLVALLLATPDGKPHPSNVAIDSTRVLRQLDAAVRDDYTAGRVLTLRGWVLSLTEARQCALYSLSQ